jgi:hypothetical protein
VIALVREVIEAVARTAGVDHVEIALRDGVARADLDAALGAPEPLPRIAGPAFERFAYPAPEGVRVYADVDDESGRVLAVLVRRDA